MANVNVENVAQPVKRKSQKSTVKRVGNTASSRLRQDYIQLMKNPVPYIIAAPLPTNILEW